MALLDHFKTGEEDFFKKLFEEHYKRLCVYAKKYTNDLDAAKDIVQDLFVKLYEDRETIEIKTSINFYLYQAVKNRCLNYARHEMIHTTHLAKIKTDNSNKHDHWNEKMLETELESKIYDSVNKLPAQCQKIFKLSREQALKNQEIADKLNISIRTVETQIFKALKTIRKDLAGYL